MLGGWKFKYVFLGSCDTVLELFIEESQALAVDTDVNAEGYSSGLAGECSAA
jgi:hypothetical protein